MNVFLQAAGEDWVGNLINHLRFLNILPVLLSIFNIFNTDRIRKGNIYLNY